LKSRPTAKRDGPAWAEPMWPPVAPGAAQHLVGVWAYYQKKENDGTKRGVACVNGVGSEEKKKQTNTRQKTADAAVEIGLSPPPRSAGKYSARSRDICLSLGRLNPLLSCVIAKGIALLCGVEERRGKDGSKR